MKPQAFLIIFCMVFRSIIMEETYDPTHATVQIIPTSGSPSVEGEILITESRNGVIILNGTVRGLSPGLHGFHIHEKGDLGNDCKNAGSHFNPFKTQHGGRSDNEHHVGDLGNILANEEGVVNIDMIDGIASLDENSQAYIGGLAIVIHAGEDDLGRGGNAESLKTGNAGARIGCGLISVEKRQRRPNQSEAVNSGQNLPRAPPATVEGESNHQTSKFAEVRIVPGSNNHTSGFVEVFSVTNGVIYAGVISGLSPGLHGFHVHEFDNLGDECRKAGGHFNPFKRNHGNLHDDDRHVGDLGNVVADENGIAVFKVFDYLASTNPISPAYIGGRSLVIHSGRDDLGKGGNPDSLKTGNAGARDGCGLILPDRIDSFHPFHPNTFRDIGIEGVFDTPLGGESPLQPVLIERGSHITTLDFATVDVVPGSNVDISGAVELRETVNGVVITGEISGLTPGFHGFHVHEFGDLGENCKKAGGHFNPFISNHGSPEDKERHVGDLGNIFADERGVANFRILDNLISADPSSEAYIGNLALVIHAGEDDLGRVRNAESLKTGNAGAREGCGLIKLKQSHLDHYFTESTAADQSLVPLHNDSATVFLIEANKFNVSGKILIYATETGVKIDGDVFGLRPGGLHGFHIHETGDLGNECKNAGGHFNPLKKNHGSPQDAERHVGDLGNIKADSNGRAKFQISDSLASLDLFSPNYVGGRSIVIHALPDDLGRGGDSESLKTGNAGTRVACGLIQHGTPHREIIFPEQHRSHSFPSKTAAQRAALIGSSRMKRDENSFFKFSGQSDSPYISPATFSSQKLMGKVHIQGGTSKSVKGDLTITQVAHQNGILIKGVIYGLSPGLHGFHVHEKGDLGGKCQNAGPHFNPFEKSHGGKTDEHRHVGDLGNIKANGRGIAHVEIFDKKGTLDKRSKAFIGNRAIVVHADKDDLGRGNNADSKRTGNSGARVGCGVVRIIPSHLVKEEEKEHLHGEIFSSSDSGFWRYP